MLRKLSLEIAECHRHAMECREKAELAKDPLEKEDFLDLERRWLFLARSYEFTQRLQDFGNEAARKATD